MARHGGVERRGGRRRLVVVTCATRWWEKLVGAATRPCAGCATLEWPRDYGRADLEADLQNLPKESVSGPGPS